MKRTLITLSIASILATGCGHAAMATRAADTAAAKPAPEATKASAEASAKDDSAPADENAKTALVNGKPVEDAKDAAPAAAPAAAATALSARKPGDFVVYKFSGSFRKEPLTISERVIDRQGSILTVDVTAESAGEKRELRVKLNDAADAKNEVISVARLEGGLPKPASPDAYEKLMAEASLSADQNEAFLGAEDVVIDVNGTPMPCHKSTYRVRVGKKTATLQTLSSDGFAWGDVGGDITTGKGKVLFRAEVVESGHVEPGKGHAVAKSDVTP